MESQGDFPLVVTLLDVHKIRSRDCKRTADFPSLEKLGIQQEKED